jgi:hypothetical protein
MENAYKAFDGKGLDTALAVIEHEAPAKVESSGEETPSDPTKQEEIVLQTRQRLSMREAAMRCNSPAIEQLVGMEATQSPVAQLLGMKAEYNRATEKNGGILRYPAWLPSDHPLPTAEPLGELLFRRTQLMREVEHLHGMLGQEPVPWLLLCRDSDLLNTDGSTELPTGYDKVYVDLINADVQECSSHRHVGGRHGGQGGVTSPACSGVVLENCTAAGVCPLDLQGAKRRPETTRRDHGA